MALSAEILTQDLSGTDTFPYIERDAGWARSFETSPDYRVGVLSEDPSDAWIHTLDDGPDVDTYLLDLDQNDTYRIRLIADDKEELSSNRSITVYDSSGRFVGLIMNNFGLNDFEGNILSSDVFIAEAGGRHIAFTKLREDYYQSDPAHYQIDLVKTNDAEGWSIDWDVNGTGAIARFDRGDNAEVAKNVTLVFDAPGTTVEQYSSSESSLINGTYSSRSTTVRQSGDTVTVEMSASDGRYPAIEFAGGQGATTIRLVEGTVNASDYDTGQIVDTGAGQTLPSFYRGTGGDDRLTGSLGADTIHGGDGNDTLVGGKGDDVIRGGATSRDLRDFVKGGEGDDTIYGGHGNDELRGEAGDDVIDGGFGADTVQGGLGDDTLGGGAYGDLMFGGDGFDFLNGGFGSDRVNGGDGADRFYHLGIGDHGSDWIQDYDGSEGDILRYGGEATLDQFQVNVADTANAGAGGVAEAFVIFRPTGQILWALVDGDGQEEIRLALGDEVFDLV